MYILPKYEIYVNQLLDYCIRIFGWMLPEDHHWYLQYKRIFLKCFFIKIYKSY